MDDDGRVEAFYERFVRRLGGLGSSNILHCYHNSDQRVIKESSEKEIGEQEASCDQQKTHGRQKSV